ncbi:MAG: hypothetical protein V7K53_02245 [Nostoc sp.]
MASSISLRVMGATLLPITLYINPDANVTNKIPDFFEKSGI